MSERDQRVVASVDHVSDAKVLIISVAARMAGMHPQTLRQYDRLGLVSPGRTPGGGRRYSERDVVLLREIQRLSQDDGVSLEGVRRIIDLETARGRSAAADHGSGSRLVGGAPTPGPGPVDDRLPGARSHAGLRAHDRARRVAAAPTGQRLTAAQRRDKVHAGAATNDRRGARFGHDRAASVAGDKPACRGGVTAVCLSMDDLCRRLATRRR